MEQKSPEAFRTISEVAEWLGVPTHVLRFWESRFTQVKPVKRAGGRRYYRPADMQLLGGIRKLLHEDGLTIRGVQKLLREQGVKHVAAMSPPLDTADMVTNVVSLDATRASQTEAEEAETVEDRPDEAAGQTEDTGADTTSDETAVDLSEEDGEDPAPTLDSPPNEDETTPDTPDTPEPVVTTALDEDQTEAPSADMDFPQPTDPDDLPETPQTTAKEDAETLDTASFHTETTGADIDDDPVEETLEGQPDGPDAAPQPELEPDFAPEDEAASPDTSDPDTPPRDPEPDTETEPVAAFDPSAPPPQLVMPDIGDDPLDGSLPPKITPIAPLLRRMRARGLGLPVPALQAFADRLAPRGDTGPDTGHNTGHDKGPDTTPPGGLG